MKRAILSLLAGCMIAGSLPTRSATAAPGDAILQLLRGRIKHVFVIYQENRSFDSYFGTFPGADGIYSQPAAKTPGFDQPMLDASGRPTIVRPFRIGPKEFAADTDDADHAHGALLAKMDEAAGAARMDGYAKWEEQKYSPRGKITPLGLQMAELTMAHEDCDTIPFLWQYAKRFVLFDRIFQEMSGPSTPGNLAIIGAQTGESQAVFHPDELPNQHGDRGIGVPVLNDSDPFWGSPKDPSKDKMPVDADDYSGSYQYPVQLNLTYPTLPLTLAGSSLGSIARRDGDRADDYRDISADVPAIVRHGGAAVPWDWFEEGYGHDVAPGSSDPLDAQGQHASYVTHHNGPQYFGYISNNPAMRAHLHTLTDLWSALQKRTLPARGVFYLKGGFQNLLGLKPADPDARAQRNFAGDDDHPGYSDAQISEAMVAYTVNAIARSPYWADSVIVITWDDSEGYYDHVPPPQIARFPTLGVTSDGPRIPLIVISPFAKRGAIVHDAGNTASVVKLVDAVFGVEPLAQLPDERRAREIALQRYGTAMGARDARGNGITALLGAFDEARLRGTLPPLSNSYAEIADRVVRTLPQESGFGCASIGITPTDAALPNPIPSNFNPRPKTEPSPG